LHEAVADNNTTINPNGQDTSSPVPKYTFDQSVTLPPFEETTDYSTPYGDVTVLNPVGSSRLNQELGLEPKNDKKFFGANLDVLHSLELINFNSYNDGALHHTIAYIQFYNPTQETTSVVDMYNFAVTTFPEQSKCLELNDKSACTKYEFADFKIKEFEALPLDLEIGTTLSGLFRQEDIGYSGNKITAPENSQWQLDLRSYNDAYYGQDFLQDDYLKDALPIPVQMYKEPLTFEKIQEFKAKADNWIKIARDATTSSPANIQFINDLISKLERASGSIDTAFRIINKAKEIFNFFFPGQPDLDVPLDESLFEPTLDIPLDESIFSASIKDPLFDKTYTCKEVLTKKEGIWQFLFNPSELDYSFNSDYAEAETWANTDGRPVHWKGNQNPTMSCKGVILNGYMFGRKVETLAQGLKDLMAFTQDPLRYRGSPPVLEFIWGKKKFGPCVMKDLSINEKMWDGGDLVSAECSFTLLAVPEWVVNDGMVDIFDPSKLPVFVPLEDNLFKDEPEIKTDEPLPTPDTTPGTAPEPTPEPTPTPTVPRQQLNCQSVSQLNSDLQKAKFTSSTPLPPSISTDTIIRVSTHFGNLRPAAAQFGKLNQLVSISKAQVGNGITCLSFFTAKNKAEIVNLVKATGNVDLIRICYNPLKAYVSNLTNLTTYKQKCTVPPLPNSNPPKSPTPVPVADVSDKVACYNAEQLVVQANAINSGDPNINWLAFLIQFNKRYGAFKAECKRLRIGVNVFERIESRTVKLVNSSFTCKAIFEMTFKQGQPYTGPSSTPSRVYNKCLKPIVNIAKTMHNGSISQCSKTTGGKI
jgi:hypothetical protein